MSFPLILFIITKMLLSLSVVASVSAFTLEMAEVVEVAVLEHQEQTLDVKALKARIQSAHYQQVVK